MPIYEYQCGSCGHQFETMQRISDAPLSECPVCGKDGLRKLISPVAFRLKGGGWYETDFKKGDARNVAKSETSSDKDGGGAESKAEKKTEAKSETKSDAKPKPASESRGASP
ncbi:MAG: zinc ribbon domain-containing protein [Gammaproteobacteria bacterium]|nr:zinc ribbon domain-containing protein [Gammaproteobacteria bacterium]MCY4278635.1 zinc ribbon domain-containing protein [Gammaproteobacteria bacterium]MCY4324181.1 zinc ribbon domain-containing protein [Gammaproteobacteria bacterium]